mgnify:CR=1 FL=1
MADSIKDPEVYEALVREGNSKSKAAAIANAVDTVAAIRSFEISSPLSASPLGRPDNMPRAVAARTGLDPRKAIQSITGGQAPQTMLVELAGTIAAGRSSGAVI